MKLKHFNWKGGKNKYICKICNKEFFAYKTMKQTFCSYRCTGIYAKHCQKSKFTSIELLIAKELKKYNIKFEPQKNINNIAIVDFFIAPKIIIQCDGEYFHNFPKQIKKDRKQNRLLRKENYRVYRLKEDRINKSPNKCIEKILRKEVKIEKRLQ